MLYSVTYENVEKFATNDGWFAYNLEMISGFGILMFQKGGK